MPKKKEPEKEAHHRKVYSPDIVSYKFEGTEGLAHTIAFALVAPFRIVSRVMHNIFVMPANIQDEFAEGLFVVAIVVGALGVVDLFVYGKWALLISQIPLLPISIVLRRKALLAVEQQAEEPTVDMSGASEEAKQMAASVYDDLEKLLKEK